jgi:molecular chaperone Hsp33
MSPDIEVRTYFVRHRNAIVARGDFSELFAAWYLHRMDAGLPVPPECDSNGREALAAVTLHCAARPRQEMCAWTVHFRNPRMNIFAAGDNAAGTVVANVFNENIREIEKDIFYADVIEPGQAARRSVTEFEGTDFLRAAEAFYNKSEQRAARFFWYGDEDLVLVAAQPDCDLDWLAALDATAIATLDADVELSLLEKRSYRFECGCTQERMLDLLRPVYLRQGSELFGDDETIRIHCPRCGSRFAITREALEAHTEKIAD